METVIIEQFLTKNNLKTNHKYNIDGNFYMVKIVMDLFNSYKIYSLTVNEYIVWILTKYSELNDYIEFSNNLKTIF